MFGILCFGDSITFGVGEKLSRGWVGRLKDFHEPKDQFNYVFNLGFPGHDTNDILERIESELKTRVRIKRDSDKFVIIIAIGTNDVRLSSEKIPRISEVQFEKNIQSLISITRKYPAKVVFVSMPPVNETMTTPYEVYHYSNDRIQLFNKLIKETCESEKILFLDVFSEFMNKNYSQLLEDGLHPNSDGYDFMYEKIKENLIEYKLV
jgi:lysophospholipase L1-like esterase